MTDTLLALIQSTQNLYERFEREFILDVQIPIFEEEVHELIAATQAKDSTTQHIAEETCDVFVTAIGMALAAGVSVEELMTQAQAVIQKNDAKTHASHYVNEQGKIARRQSD
ncbi:MAG: hypothetical protein CUN55_01745 [Phototrophicales bacterium]|nr:MAG: hypothetical protein CUN55_01745 [Phototrophicales bacterium]